MLKEGNHEAAAGISMHAPKRIAHRGMPRRITENTIESFQLALDSGADGVELDVHLSGDGVVVVHHDPDLADGGIIAEITHREILERNPAFRVPALREVFELISGSVELFIEIKGAGIEREVLAAVREYQGPFALHSFDHALIERARRLHDEVRLGVLLGDSPSGGVQALMERTGALDVWPHFPLVTPDLVAAVHGAGGRVIPYTVNAPADIEAMRQLGVDGICTDDVTRM